MRRALALGVLALAAGGGAQTTSVVVPGAYAFAEAPHAELFAFAPFAARRQLIVDERHLTALSGRALVALALRRNQGDADANTAGRLHLQVWCAPALVGAATAREEFAANRGRAVRVFQGNVDLPDCAAAPVTPAPWTAPYAVELPFAIPYSYLGGNLCIETLTTGPQGMAPWWAVDAVIEDLGGTVATAGTSCVPALPGSPAGGDPATFALGARATFWLRGPQSEGPVLCLLGASDQHWNGLGLPLDLTPFGLAGCVLHNDVCLAVPALLTSLPQASFTLATYEVRLPEDLSLAGGKLFTQWLVLGDAQRPILGLSNGVQATLGTARSTLGVFWLEATDPAAMRGRALPGRAPVLRLRASG